MDTISQRELRNDNAAVIRRVAAGESFVVTRRGVPIADLVPHSADSKPPRFPRAVDFAAAMADLLDEPLEEWLEERAELDAAADQGVRDPWQEA